MDFIILYFLINLFHLKFKLNLQNFNILLILLLTLPSLIFNNYILVLMFLFQEISFFLLIFYFINHRHLKLFQFIILKYLIYPHNIFYKVLRK